jgi:hypothetical protein
MELKVPLDMETFATLEEIAKFHGKTVDEVATELVKAGLQNFLRSAGPLSTH